MIDIEKTISLRGYDPLMLKPKSNKRVWCICNECGAGRWVIYFQYSDLCRSCSQTGKTLSDEHRKKLSVSHLRENLPEGTIERMREAHLGVKRGPHSKATCDKISKSNMGREVSKATRNKISCTLMGRYVGEDSPSWLGGLSFEPYCDKFTEKLKQQVRDLYNNCDFISGIPDFICNIVDGKAQKLDVHHVDSNKNQGCDEVEWKLVPLSRRNHTKTNFNRLFWERLICYSLEYDATYYDYDCECVDIMKL